MSEQRIEFDYNRLLGLYNGGQMDAGRGSSARAKRVRELVMNNVLEFLRDTFEESGKYDHVKDYPASTGDDRAVLILFDGPGLRGSDVNVVLQNHLIEALNDMSDADFEGRKDNPGKSAPKEHTIEINYDRLCKVQSQLDSILRDDYVTASYDLDDCAEELCHTICIYLQEDMIQGEVPGVTGVVKAYGGNHGRIIYTGRKLSEAKADAMLAEAVPHALEELADHIEMLDDDDREDNPRKSGLPLGSLALGAAIGAAAMHFGMKPKQ